MKHLADITHATFGLPEKTLADDHKKRRAARAIIINDKKEVALIYTHKHGHHKLPGGGIEQDENWEKALMRECMEEAGCTITIIRPIGIIYEERIDHDFVQTSICALAHLKKILPQAQLTSDEIDDGYEPAKWYPYEKAVELMHTELPKTYIGKFMHKRDLIFLEEAIRHI